MIPKCISDISHDWIIHLMEKLYPELGHVATLTSLSLNTCSEELFECCRLSFAAATLDDGRQTTYHWLIKLMPTDPDLREIVLRHDLFKKEMLVHQIVIPELHKFVAKKGT